MNDIIKKLEAKKKISTQWQIKLLSNESAITKTNGYFNGYCFSDEKLIILCNEGNPITDVSLEIINNNGQTTYTVNGELASVVTVEVDKFYERHKGIELTKDIGSRYVLLCGAGSVGSRCAVHLVPAGVKVGLMDYDHLDIQNFVRWGIALDWKRNIGRKKVNVLEEYLQKSYPNRTIVHFDFDVVGNQDKLLSILKNDKPDLIICSTDTEISRKVINSAAWAYGIPALYVGLSDAAKSGQIILCSPVETPCYQCFVGAGISRIESDQGRVYGTAEGVPALGVNISLITAIAANIALYLLRFGVKETQKEYFSNNTNDDPLGNVLWFSNERTWVFDKPFQKLTAAVERDPKCGCCGKTEAS